MARNAKKLTVADLKGLAKLASEDPSLKKFMADAGQPGLSIQVRNGRVRFLFTYKSPTSGKRRRQHLDDFGAITLHQARDIAQSRRADVAAGIDPLDQAEEVRKRAERAEREAVTVADAVRDYLEDYEARATSDMKGKRSGFYSAKRRLHNSVLTHPVARRRLVDLRKEHLKDLVGSMSDRPVEANRTYTALVSALVRAEKSLPEPCPRLDRKKDLYVERGARIKLTDDQLRALGEVLNEAQETGKVVLLRDNNERSYAIHPSAVFALRFLALTGFRRADLLGHMAKARRNGHEGLRWKHVNLEEAAIYVEDPKSGMPQERTIGKAAVEILRSVMPEDASPDDPVCPGDVAGQPFIGIDRPRRRLWEAAKIEDQVGRRVDLHSLRHSFASIAANLEHGRYVGHVSALLGHGHQRNSITERYIDSDPEALRASADAISGRIADLLGLSLGTTS
ncbi:MAG: integrase family protein [Thermoanaerobaculia bacterium]|nr:integrase family protein [Thermoanaerobaculia bacterium]